MIRPTANYDTEWPNDHEFFFELSILKNNLRTIFVATSVGLGEFDCKLGLPSIDYFVCGKIRRKAFGTECEGHRWKKKQKETHGEVRPRLEVEVNFTSTKRTLERGTDVVMTSVTFLPV